MSLCFLFAVIRPFVCNYGNLFQQYFQLAYQLNQRSPNLCNPIYWFFLIFLIIARLLIDYKFGIIIMEKIKQQLSLYFPSMPTWANIQSVLIVQPNGKILSQYCQVSQRQKTIKLQLVTKHVQQKNGQQNSPNQTSQQNKTKQTNQVSSSNKQTKKTQRHKYQTIVEKVIDSARKLLRQMYQNQLNKLIVDANLVYYRAKYNVIVIIVVKKFSVSVKEIQELMRKIFNWYYEKCLSMNIDINLPNTKINQYQEGQFKKLQWEIAHQIDQKVANIQVNNISNTIKSPKQEIVKEKLQHISQILLSREEKLKQIGEKVFFRDFEGQIQENQKNKIIENILGYFFPSLKKQKLPKKRKFQRQLSFMGKSVYIAKQMRLRMLLFYFCMIVALVWGSMVYFGWFRQSED